MSFVTDIADFVKGVITDVYEFLTDLPLVVMEGVLDAVAWVIESIPMPEFMGSAISDHLPDTVIWFLVQSGFGACLGAFAAGIIFYFLRRVLTLGIW